MADSAGLTAVKEFLEDTPRLRAITSEIGEYIAAGGQSVETWQSFLIRIESIIRGIDPDVTTVVDEVQALVNQAQAAVTAANVASKVYATPAAGVAAGTGVPVGEYYNVRSANEDSYIDEYQNVGGVATATGKSYPSGAIVDALENQITVVVNHQSAIIVDRVAQIVKYPITVVSRPGANFTVLNPAATYAELPFREVDNIIAELHYLDLSQVSIGADAVFKFAGLNGAPQPSKDIVYIAITYKGQYHSLWSSNVVWTDRKAVTSIVSTALPIIVDRNGRLGGGAAAYIPSRIFTALPEQSTGGDLVPSNAPATEIAGYAKLALPNSYPGAIITVYLDIGSNTYKVSSFPAFPTGTNSGVIPLLHVWGSGAHSPSGLQVVDEDQQRLSNRLRTTTFVFQHPVIVDLANVYGGGAAVYVPRKRFFNRNDAATTNTVVGDACVELGANYCKLLVPGGIGTLLNDIVTIIYNDTNNTYSLVMTAQLNEIDAILDKAHIILQLWNDVVKSDFDVVSSLDLVVKNEHLYGRDHGSHLFFGGTIATPVTDPIMNALGVTAGGTNPAPSRTFISANINTDTKVGMFFARFYTISSTDNAAPPATTFMKFTDDGELYSIAVFMEKRLSPRVCSFIVRVPLIEGVKFINAGTEPSGSATTFTICGLQYGVYDRKSTAAIAEWPIITLTNDYPPTPVPVPAPADINLVAQDARNMSYSELVRNRKYPTLQSTTAAYNVFGVYGQSLARGQETSPPLSITNKYDNRSWGGNPLPADDGTGQPYNPFAAADFLPLVARTVNGSFMYTDPNQADQDAGAFGEPPNHGWVNTLKSYHNQRVMAENDAARTFVTFNAAVSGMTIEQLSKVNPQDSINRYARVTSVLTQMKTKATAEGKSVVMPAFVWCQGEFNYTNYGGSVDKATYKIRAKQLFSDIRADTKTILGQTKDVAIFMMQTGAQYTSNFDGAGIPGLHVGMAQLETSLEMSGVFLVGPLYPFTDKGGHLDPNGSRWMGCMIAKVNDKIASGEGWEPLRPTRIVQYGQTIDIDYHVPYPPLKFSSSWYGFEPAQIPSQGFEVTDADGNVPLTASIVAGTVVRLTLGRATNGTVNVWYASATFGGHGNLHDSDPTVALENYEYRAVQGAYPASNIAELVGKPYPLWNWAVAFFGQVGYENR